MALGLGLGLPFVRSAGGASGPANSPARGFYLPQDTYYGVDSVIGAGADSTAYTMSFWVFGLWDVKVSGTGSPTGGMNGGILMSQDPTTHYEIPAGASPGAGLTFEDPNAIVFNFNNTPGTTDATDTVKFLGTTPTTAPAKGQWNHYIISWDSHTGKWACYRNGVDISGSMSATIRADCKWNLFNNKGFKLNGYVGTTGSGAFSSSWMSDVWVAQTYIGDTGNAGANTIPAATLAKFISGGLAVDLGTDGSAPLGSVPAVFIGDRGDGVPTQRGAATATFAYGSTSTSSRSTLTAGSAGSEAPYGPGAAIPSNRPVSVIQVSQFAFGAVTSFSVTSNGQPVNDGDMVIIAVTGNDSTVPGTHNPTITGYTRVSDGYDTVQSFECALFYRKLGVGEGNAAGISVTVNLGSAYDRGTGAAMFVIRNVSSIDQAVMRRATSANTTQGVLAGNTTQAQTLMSFYFNRSADPGSGPITLATPAAGYITHRTRVNAAPLIMAVMEDGVAAGASYQRNLLRSGASASDTWFAAAIGLVP